MVVGHHRDGLDQPPKMALLLALIGVSVVTEALLVAPTPSVVLRLVPPVPLLLALLVLAPVPVPQPAQALLPRGVATLRCKGVWAGAVRGGAGLERKGPRLIERRAARERPRVWLVSGEG